MRVLLLMLMLTIGVRAETISVPSGGDLQAAINAANPGDVIVLQAGAVYSGNFVLKVKTGDAPITLQSSRCGELPLGQRVSLTSTPQMAQLATPNVGPVLLAPVYTHHYKFQCLEFTQGAQVGEWGYNLIQMGEGASYENQKTMESVPHHFDFDRVIVRARDALTGLQRGMTLNSASTTITNSYFSDIKWKGTETQCVGGWNGPGPYLIENNYLESAGINILFGGATPAIPNLVPSDITIRGNVMTKRLEWKGQGLAVKNLFELKNARRVTFTENFLEYSWPDAQVGWAVIMNTFRDGGWEVVDDVQFTRNVIRNTTNGINLRGHDEGDTATRMHRIYIADNRIEGLGYGGTEQKAFQVLNSSEDVTIEHNTVTNCINSLLMQSGDPLKHVRLKFNNNLIPHGSYGVFSDGGAIGVDAMNERASQWEMAKNALIATPADLQSKYPNTYFPATAADATGLLGSDGQSVGVRSGVAPSPTPTPVPLPSPTPTPVPSPSPTPPTIPCSITVPQSVSMSQWSSVTVTVIGNNLNGTITATGSTGQVTVTPTSRTVSGTSFTAQYRVDSKKKSSSVRFDSPCGGGVMQVVVN